MRRPTADDADPLVPRRDPARRVPLLPSQTAMWIAERLHPGDPIYNENTTHRVRGPLDVAALRRSLDRLVERHEPLRTAYADDDGEPQQEVLATRPFPFEVVDMTGASDDEVRAAVSAFAARPFDLRRGDVARALLVRCAEDDHVFAVTLHHIVRDGWATGVVHRELRVLYDAFVAGREPELAALPVSFADIVVWRADAAAAGALDAGRKYWRTRLAGAPPLSAPPADRPRSGDDSAGAFVEGRLDRATVAALRAHAKAAGASFFMTLMAVWTAYLSRCTGQTDIVTGFPVAGRTPRVTEAMIANLVNTVVLRTNVDPAAPFHAHLARVRDDLRAAYEHLDVPFEAVIADSGVERRRGCMPLMQTLATLRSWSPLELAGLEVVSWPVRTPVAKADVSLDMQEDQDGLFVFLEYRRALYDAATAERMLGHVLRLMRAVAVDPDAPIASHDILGDDERRALTTFVAAPSGTPQRIEQVVAARAAATPDAVAVTMASERMTYAQLQQRASAIAAGLKAGGIGPGSVVAVAQPASFDVIATLLAVLQTGAAYVPIDAQHPADHVRVILEDAGAQLLVRNADDIAAPAGTHAADAPLTDVDAPAYLLPTSGSTGRPKLVAVSHRSLWSYLQAVVPQYGLSARDCVLQFASITFDTSVEEIFATLACGATLVLATADMRRDPHVLTEAIRSAEITVLDLPTAAWHVLVEYLEQHDESVPPSVRLAIVGGEAMAPAAAAAWCARRGDGSRLLNSYGPTEATVSVTYAEIGDAPETEADVVPVGRPLPGVRAYVLDADRRLVPYGVTGELALAGPQLALGYYRDADRTAAAFVEDPFAADGSRMYLTGDRARRRADGSFEILGRRDGQVKIRGARVELAAVESVVARHPAVHGAAVVARRRPDGAQTLLAYIVAAADAAPAVQAWCEEHLPSYAVPRIVTLSAFPITPNGKIDRAALPEPADAPVDARYAAPRTDVERAIVAEWEALLDRRPIGVHDNFFALGGHSLLAARLVSRLERVLGRRLPLATLFRAQTVATLAAAVAAESRPEPVALVEVQRGDGGTPFFFFHGDLEAPGTYVQRVARAMGPTQRFYAVIPHGVDEPGSPVPTIEAMARDRLRAIRAVQPHGPYRLGGYCNGGTVAFEAAQQLAEAGEEVEVLALVNAPRGLAGVPLLRTVCTLTAQVQQLDGEAGRLRYVVWHDRMKRLQRVPLAERLAELRRRRTAGETAIAVRTTGQTIMQRYGVELDRYAPRAYAGRIFQIRSVDERGRSFPHMDWRAYAFNTVEVTFPGTHADLVRVHCERIGIALAGEVERVEALRRAGTTTRGLLVGT